MDRFTYITAMNPRCLHKLIHYVGENVVHHIIVQIFYLFSIDDLTLEIALKTLNQHREHTWIESALNLIGDLLSPEPLHPR